MRAVLILAAVVATGGACALAATVRTASETFVTNKVAEVKARVDAVAAASTNYVDTLIVGLAPKTMPHVFADGTTNQVGVVRSNVELLIREVETANGQKRFRLILKTN